MLSLEGTLISYLFLLNCVGEFFRQYFSTKLQITFMKVHPVTDKQVAELLYPKEKQFFIRYNNGDN